MSKLTEQQALTRKKRKFIDRVARDRRLTGRAVGVAIRIVDRVSVKNSFA